MYRFEATYYSYDTDLEMTELIEIDTTSIPEEVTEKSIFICAMRLAFENTELLPELKGWHLGKLEFISC